MRFEMFGFVGKNSSARFSKTPFEYMFFIALAFNTLQFLT